MRCLTLDTRMEISGTTQYQSFGFAGMVAFQGKLIGINPSGLFELAGDTDAGTPILAEIGIPMGDLGIQMNKKLRDIYFGLEARDDLEVDIIVDDKDARTYSVPADNIRRGIVTVCRDLHGRYWKMIVSNPGGGMFSLDSIITSPIRLPHGHL